MKILKFLALPLLFSIFGCHTNFCDSNPCNCVECPKGIDLNFVLVDENKADYIIKNQLKISDVVFISKHQGIKRNPIIQLPGTSFYTVKMQNPGSIVEIEINGQVVKTINLDLNLKQEQCCNIISIEGISVDGFLAPFSTHYEIKI